MKRLLIVLLLLIATNVYAGGDFWSKCSDEQTESAVITTSPGIFHKIVVTIDAQLDTTISIYDSATASTTGRKLIPTTAFATEFLTGKQVHSLEVSPGVRFYNGIYVVTDYKGVSSYEVYYKNEND